jgi:DNA-directed RNA polymerase subunit RPC12/RpoP
MAYQCPRCGQEVEQNSNRLALVLGGVVGAMLFSAFASYNCWQCGPIAKEEFPAEVRSKMAVGTVALVVGAVVLAGLAILLIAAIGAS